MTGPRTAPAQPRRPATSLRVHLRRAKDHIDRRYDEDFDLDEIARVAGVSRYHFVRSFREVYGETPMRYRSRRRIERAQDLLRSVNLTVTEICMAVGFASLGTFSTRFTELVGESPTAYRDRWAVSGAPPVPGCWLFMLGVLRRPTDAAVDEPVVQVRDEVSNREEAGAARAQ